MCYVIGVRDRPIARPSPAPLALCLAAPLLGCGDGSPPDPRPSTEPTGVATASEPAPAGRPPAPARLPATQATRDPLAKARARRGDPGEWKAEAVDAAVHTWWELVLGGAPTDQLAASDCVLGPLVPTEAEAATPIEAGAFRTRLAGPPPTDAVGGTGPGALSRALAQLFGPDGPGALEHAKLKVVGVELDPPADPAAAVAPRTELLLELAFPHAPGRGRSQVRARLAARWTAGEPLRLVELRRLSFEATEPADPPPSGALFTDITAEVLGANSSFERQLSVSLADWSERLDVALGTSVIGHEGLALGDADGDGLDDLYVCQPGGLPNLLFLRRPDGRAEDVSRAAGVDWLDASRSALFCDLDGDGDQDLVVEADPSLLLMRNEGGARFVLAAVADAPATTSLSAADPDGDGDLDLYACAYVLPDHGERVPLPYHDANNGRRNTFLMNRASEGRPFELTDATQESGLDRNNRRFSFAAAWEDFDLDGDQDLYVANDFGRNNLYRNDTEPGGAPQFTDVAAELGVEDLAAGMGVTWADVDGDLRPDLYVSNMFSSAGGRIAYQRRFRSGADEAERAGFRRHARGNTLFLNTAEGFRDATAASGAGMGRWAWGALFTDFENDGRPDLVVPNGFVTGADPLDL